MSRLADTLDVLDTLNDRTNLAELAMRLKVGERAVERRLEPLRAWSAVQTIDGDIITTPTGRTMRDALMSGMPPDPHPDIERATLTTMALQSVYARCPR